jgi:hypothetical protein
MCKTFQTNNTAIHVSDILGLSDFPILEDFQAYVAETLYHN